MLPTILIHGFPLDSAMWAPQLFTLSKFHFGKSIHAIDLPGFGESKEPPLDSIEAMAAHVHEKIAALGGKAIVGGLSMGGYVLFSLLRQFPGDIAGAIFLDTRADADSAEAKQNRANAIAEIKTSGPAKVYETLLKRLVAAGAREEVKAELRQMMERQNPQTVMAAQRAMMDRRDQTDLLGEIRVPALFVVGEHDAITPPAVARAMHERTAGSKLAEIENAGHMSNMENAAAVNLAIGDFLARLPA